MSNKTNSITLTPASIAEVQKLCETIRLKNPKNEISVNMSKGISDFVQEYGFVSDKQAQWLCRNADFWKLQRPAELSDLVMENGRKGASPSVSSANLLIQIVEHLKQAVTLLEMVTAG